MSPAWHPKNVERILDHQMLQWDLRRRVAEEDDGAGRGKPARAEGPWISISKQAGAESEGIAEILGGSLGWQVFDRELVEAIARETSTRERVLSRLDEKAVSRFDEWLAQLIVPGQRPQVAYLQEMARVIWALAKHGHVILLGRGANWFLDARHGLRVRIVAPHDVRVARIAAQEALSPKEAERWLRSADASTAAFIRQVYRRDIDDPLGYDLVVNTGALEREVAAEAILGAARSKLGELHA